MPLHKLLRSVCAISAIGISLSMPVGSATAAQVCVTQDFGSRDFRGISGSSDNNVIGVGQNGEIYRFDGVLWAPMANASNEHLNDVEVVDASTAFAVGNDGEVLRLSGSSWVSIGGFTSEDLYGVWAASATEAYAVGNRGTLFSYDGVGWTDQSGPAGTNNRDLEDAWGNANSFYALSDRGELYRYDRNTGIWDSRDSACAFGNGFGDLWGDASGNIYMLRRTRIYRHSGTSCSLTETASENLHGIYGSDLAGRIFAGGNRGTVEEFDGTGWQESTPANEDIRDVWVADSGTAYYAGESGEITSCSELVPELVADWPLDDCTLAFAGSSVVDTGPNGLDGSTVGGMNVQNDGQLCSAGQFDGSSAYIDVADAAALDVDDGLSIAVWVRHETATYKPWEAILAKGDSSYRLHLNGGCEISDALPGNVPFGITLGLNGGCSDADLNSNLVPQPGVWYHVAATYDRSMMHIYINGNLVNSAAHGTAINTNNFDLFIGENSQQTGRHWTGDIDELTLWNGAISLQQIQQHRDRTRPCSNCSGVEFIIAHDSFGINCLDEAMRIDVVDSVAGTPRTDYNSQITLDTQAGRGTWSLVSGGGTFSDVTADDGVATYDWPLGESSAEFALSYTSGSATFDVDIFQSSDTSVRDDDSEGPLTYSPNGFTLTAIPLSNPPGAVVTPFSATQVAGAAFPVYLAAYGQIASDPVCGIIETYTGPRDLKFWFNYVDPAGGSIAAQIDGAAITAVEASALDQTVTFNNGQAVVAGKYKDVGRLQISVKDDSQSHPDLPSGIRGATAGFVVKPFRFSVSAIEDGSGNPNPVAGGPGDAAFVAAGEAFSATVIALDAEGSVTPNYGQESIAEGVRLTPNLVAPAAGDNPPLGAASGFGPFVAGQASGSNFVWPEVGIITLTPSIADADYLGAGDVSGTTSQNVGRFHAHHFTTTMNVPTFSTSCTAGSYTYIGESFAYSNNPVITFTARALAGEVTENYTGGFFKVDNASLPAPLYTASPATLDISGLPDGSSDPSVADAGAGVGTLTFSSGSGLWFTRTGVETPFDADIRMTIDILDSDGTIAVSNPVGFGDPGGILFDNGATMRFGRTRFLNAYGSELVDLQLPLRTEYYADANSGFVPNIDDACSADIAVTLGAFTENLGIGETCVHDSGAPGLSGAGCALAGPPALQYRRPPLGGNYNLFLRAPGANNDGSTTATADVPSWLEFDWDGTSPGLEDPRGTAVFGIYEGTDRSIYFREVY